MQLATTLQGAIMYSSEENRIVDAVVTWSASGPSIPKDDVYIRFAVNTPSTVRFSSDGADGSFSSTTLQLIKRSGAYVRGSANRATELVFTKFEFTGDGSEQIWNFRVHLPSAVLLIAFDLEIGTISNDKRTLTVVSRKRVAGPAVLIENRYTALTMQLLSHVLKADTTLTYQFQPVTQTPGPLYIDMFLSYKKGVTIKFSKATLANFKNASNVFLKKMELDDIKGKPVQCFTYLRQWEICSGFQAQSTDDIGLIRIETAFAVPKDKLVILKFPVTNPSKQKTINEGWTHIRAMARTNQGPEGVYLQDPFRLPVGPIPGGSATLTGSIMYSNEENNKGLATLTWSGKGPSFKKEEVYLRIMADSAGFTFYCPSVWGSFTAGTEQVVKMGSEYHPGNASGTSELVFRKFDYSGDNSVQLVNFQIQKPSVMLLPKFILEIGTISADKTTLTPRGRKKLAGPALRPKKIISSFQTQLSTHRLDVPSLLTVSFRPQQAISNTLTLDIMLQYQAGGLYIKRSQVSTPARYGGRANMKLRTMHFRDLSGKSVQCLKYDNIWKVCDSFSAESSSDIAMVSVETTGTIPTNKEVIIQFPVSNPKVQTVVQEGWTHTRTHGTVSNALIFLEVHDPFRVKEGPKGSEGDGAFTVHAFTALLVVLLSVV
eukprot:Platyproteum_vivax@DN1674_c0_g1_i1.p1